MANSLACALDAEAEASAEEAEAGAGAVEAEAGAEEAGVEEAGVEEAAAVEAEASAGCPPCVLDGMRMCGGSEMVDARKSSTVATCSPSTSTW